jgi:hypothetical protein
MSIHISIEDRLKSIVSQALSDQNYFLKLKENKSIFLKEAGLCTKNDIEIEFKPDISAPIFENGFLYIPLSEEWIKEKEDLTDDDLLRVAGGFGYNVHFFINNIT